jgi:hypothetical protein
MVIGHALTELEGKVSARPTLSTQDSSNSSSMSEEYLTPVQSKIFSFGKISADSKIDKMVRGLFKDQGKVDLKQFTEFCIKKSDEPVQILLKVFRKCLPCSAFILSLKDRSVLPKVLQNRMQKHPLLPSLNFSPPRQTGRN